jgi:hypothetical protein
MSSQNANFAIAAGVPFHARTTGDRYERAVGCDAGKLDPPSSLHLVVAGELDELFVLNLRNKAN